MCLVLVYDMLYDEKFRLPTKSGSKINEVMELDISSKNDRLLTSIKGKFWTEKDAGDKANIFCLACRIIQYKRTESASV